MLAPAPAKHLQASEAAVVLRAVDEGAEQQTQLLENRSQATPVTDNPSKHSLLPLQASSDDGLTRVGSILGTPLYMSPEQCRSEPLDARSDIYSLGVIAYQMLAGQTPFAGDPHSVMQQHIEAPPPPLKERRRDVPKKLAKLVMSALAKDSCDRPAGAAGFASALRANAEGIGMLVRRSFALYSEHFMQFFRMSLLLNLPMIVLAIIQVISELLKRAAIISPFAADITQGAVAVTTYVADFLVTSAITGVTIRLVTQLNLAPAPSDRPWHSLRCVEEATEGPRCNRTYRRHHHNPRRLPVSSSRSDPVHQLLAVCTGGDDGEPARACSPETLYGSG